MRYDRASAHGAFNWQEFIESNRTSHDFGKAMVQQKAQDYVEELERQFYKREIYGNRRSPTE